jgi:hypothetical protein
MRPSPAVRYQLALDDGRSGTIEIERVTAAGQQTIVFFRGAGPLA